MDTERLERGGRAFDEVMTFPAPDGPNPATTNGLIDFVFGEVWLRPGLGMKERGLVTAACVAFRDAPYSIMSHVYAALKSRDVSFNEMDKLALHFGAYYGWAEASNLNR